MEELAAPELGSPTAGRWWTRTRPGWNWTPDVEAADCELCDVPFSLLRRRHHCLLSLAMWSMV